MILHASLHAYLIHVAEALRWSLPVCPNASELPQRAAPAASPVELEAVKKDKMP